MLRAQQAILRPVTPNALAVSGGTALFAVSVRSTARVRRAILKVGVLSHDHPPRTPQASRSLSLDVLAGESALRATATSLHPC